MYYALVWLLTASLLSAWAYADEQKQANTQEVISVQDEVQSATYSEPELDNDLLDEVNGELPVPEIKPPSRLKLWAQKLFDRMPTRCQQFCVVLYQKGYTAKEWVAEKWQCIWTTEEK